MIKIFIRILIVLFVMIVLLLTLFSFKMARQIGMPKGMSLEEEKQWEKTHGVWSDYDENLSDKYTVKGKDDYTLHCQVISSAQTQNSKKYVIISHGYNSNRNGAVKYAETYLSLGFKCIVYDLRGHGENEKTACTIGNYESQDLIKIIDDTYSRFGGDIYLGLHGESMGSSTSLSALKYKPDVHFVVADCGFTNLYSLIQTQLSNYKMGFTAPFIDADMRILYGFSMKDTNAKDALSENAIPICFIHGGSDTFISPENSEIMKNTTQGYSEIYIVDNAEHAQSREVLGCDEYTSIVGDFIETVCSQELAKTN